MNAALRALICGATLLLAASPVFAQQDFYWDEDQTPDNYNWTLASNWEKSATGNTDWTIYPGDTSDPSVPVNLHRAIFAGMGGAGDSCTLSAGSDLTIGELTLRNTNTSYSGNVTIHGRLTIIDSGGFATAGNFTWNNASGDATGTFTISSTGALIIYGSAAFQEPGNLVNEGTIEFQGASPKTWSARSGLNWGAVEVSRTAQLTLTSSIGCTQLTVKSGTLAVDTNTLTVDQDLIIDGANALVTVGSGSIVVTGNVIVRNGGTLQIGSGSLQVAGDITVEEGFIEIASGTVTASSVSIGDGTGTDDATLDLGTGTVTLTRDFTLATDGVLDFDVTTPGQLKFAPAASAMVTLLDNKGVPFPVVEVAGAGSGSTLTVTNPLTVAQLVLTQGVLDPGNQVVTVTGNVSAASGASLTNFPGLTFAGTTLQTWSDASGGAGLNWGAVTVTNPAGVQLGSSTAVSAKQLTLTNGDLDVNGQTLSFVGTGIDDPLSVSGTSKVTDSFAGTIRFAGTPMAGGNVLIPPDPEVEYHHLVIEGPNLSTSYALTANTSPQASLRIVRGNLTLGGFTLDVAGPATIDDGGELVTNAGGLLRVANDLTVDGPVNASNGTLDVGGDLLAGPDGLVDTITGGNIELADDADLADIALATTGDLKFKHPGGSDSQQVTIDSDDTFGTITVAESSSGGVVVNVEGGGTHTLTLAGLTIATGKLTLGTTSTVHLNVTGPTSIANGTLLLDEQATFGGTVALTAAAGSLHGGSGLTTFNGSTTIDGALVLTTGELDVNGTLTVGSNGAFNQSGQAATFAGDVDLSAMAASAYTNPGDVTFDRTTGDQSLTLPNAPLTFDDIAVALGSASSRLNVSGGASTELVARSVTVDTGVLALDTDLTVPQTSNATSLTVNADGRFELSNATTPRTIVLRGANASDVAVLINDGGEFVATGAAHVISFQGNDTIDVNQGILTTVFWIDGTTGTITLQESDGAPDDPRWTIDVDAGVSFVVKNALIRDSNAAGTGAPLAAVSSTLDNTNALWVVGRKWNGSSSTNWNDPNNWSPPGVPSGSEAAIFDATSNPPAAQPAGGLTGFSPGSLLVTSAFFGTLTLGDGSLVLQQDLSWSGAGGATFMFNGHDLEVGRNATITNAAAGFGTGPGQIVLERPGVDGAVTLVLAGTPALNVGLKVGDTGTNTSVTLPSSLVVNGLTEVASGSTLTLAGNQLTANGGLTVDGTLNASGGTPTETSVRTTNLTVSGVFMDGDENVAVSGNLVIGGTWTDDAGLLIFDGGGTQGWSGAANVGEVQINDAHVLLGSDVNASSVTVAPGETLEIGAHRLTVTDTLQVAGLLTGGNGTGGVAVDTHNFTITSTGTYAEGAGATRVSGNLEVSGGWTNDPAGMLIFDGTANQAWTGTGTVPTTGVGEVRFEGPARTIQLGAETRVVTLVATASGQQLNLNGQTLYVFGNGAVNPPLDLSQAADLTGTGLVILERPGATDTLIDGLNYPDLRLTRASGLPDPATYRPQDGPLVIAGALELAPNTIYDTADASSTQRGLTVQGPTTIDGELVAAGPVALTFDGTTTVGASGSLTAGSAGLVTAAFAADVSVVGAVTVGAQGMDATFARNLSVSGTFNHPAGTVTMNRGADQPVAMSLANTSFAALTLRGNGNYTLTGDLSVTGALAVLDDGTSFAMGGPSNTVTAGSLQVMGDDATFSMADSSGLLTVGAGLAIDQGTVTLGSGGATIGGSITFGTGGTVRSLTLDGTVRLAGDLVGTNATSFTVQAGSTLRLEGTAAQTLTLTSVVNTFRDVVVAKTGGTASVTGNAWNVAGTLTAQSGSLALGTATSAGAVLVSGGSLTTGANVLTIGPGGLSVTSGTFSIDGAATTTVAGQIDVDGGALTIDNGAGVLYANGGLTVGTATFTSAGTLQFGGPGPWSAAVLTDFGDVEVVTGANVTASGTFLRCGTLDVHDGAMTIDANSQLTALGLVTLADGTMTLAATSELILRGGLTTNSAAALNNAGLLRFEGPLQSVQGPLDLGAVVVATTVTAGSDLTVGPLNAQGGGMLDMGAWDLTVRGSVDLASSGGGALVLDPASTLTIEATQAGPSTFSFQRGTSPATSLGNVRVVRSAPATDLEVSFVTNPAPAGVPYIGGTLEVTAGTTVNLQVNDFRVQGETTIAQGGTVHVGAPTEFSGKVTVSGTLNVAANANFNGATTCVDITPTGHFLNTATAVTLRFRAGALLNVQGGGHITVDPSGGGQTDLESLTPNTQFLIEIAPTATQFFRNIRVRDSNGDSNGVPGDEATSPNATCSGNGTELSNVTNWLGLDKAIFRWVGTGATGNWSDGNNYNGPNGVGELPFDGARLVFDAAGSGRPAPSTGVVPPVGEIEVTSTYQPDPGAAEIVITTDRALSGSFVLDSADATVRLANVTLTVRGPVKISQSMVTASGAGLLALEGTNQSLEVLGPRLDAPVRIGNGVDAASVSLSAPLEQIRSLVVSTNAAMTTNGNAVSVAGASTIAGDLAASTSVYSSGGSFDATGPGLVTFTTGGGLAMTSPGTLSLGPGDQLWDLTISPGVTVVQGGSEVIDVDGTLQVSGSFQLTTGLNLAGPVNLPGTLTAGATSLVTLDGGGNRTVTISSDVFHHLTVASTVGTVTIDGDMQVAGNLRIDGGTLDLQTHGPDLSVGGTTTLSGNLRAGPGSVTLSGDVTVNGGGTLRVEPFSFGGALVADGTVSLEDDGTIAGEVSGTGTIALVGAVIVQAADDWTFSGGQTPGESLVRFTKPTPAQARNTFNRVEIGAGGLQLVADLTATEVTGGSLILVDTGNVGHTLHLTGGAAAPLQVTNLVGFAGAALGTVRYETSVGSTIPALDYGHLTIAPAVATVTFPFAGATSVEGDLTVTGTAVTVTFGAALDVEGDVAIGGNTTLRATSSAAALSASTISGGGTLDLNNFEVVVTLEGGGAPLGIEPQNLAAGSTIVYAAPSTVREGFAYGNLVLQATGAYDLPDPLSIRGDFVQNGTTDQVVVRFIGGGNSFYHMNADVRLTRLEVAKDDTANTVTLGGTSAQQREVDRTVVTKGILSIQTESITLHGTPTPNEFGVAGQLIADDAKVLVQAPNTTLTLGSTNVHGAFYVGATTSTGITLVFKDSSTLSLTDAADFEIVGPGSGSKLIVRTQTPDVRSFIAAPVLDVAQRILVVDAQVRDNDANQVNGGITAVDSNDDGNNVNWFFQGGGNIVGVRATALGDGLGRLTRVQILFDSESDLLPDNIAYAHVGFELVQLAPDGTTAVSVPGTSASILNVGTPKRTLEVVFGTGLGKTDTRDVLVRYTPPASNRLTNQQGKPASVAFSLAPVDGAPPALIGTSFQDVDQNGAIDRGVFFFSEEVGFTARRGVSISRVNPVETSTALGTNLKLRINVAGQTLSEIDLGTGGTKISGAAIAAFIQQQVRSRAGELPPLQRPAATNFTCAFVDGRYVLRAGLPLAYNDVAQEYSIDYARSTVVVEAAPSNDAAPQLGLGVQNGGVETPGSGNGRLGMTWSKVLDADAPGLANADAAVSINGEDPVLIAIAGAAVSLEDVAADLQTKLRARASEPQHASNARSYEELVVIPHRLTNPAQGRLVIVSGGEGSGSSAQVVPTSSALDLHALAFAPAAGAVVRGGLENTEVQIDDLNVFSATGRNLLLGRTDANVVASGSTIVVEFTNAPGDGVAAPRFVWADDGDRGFIADTAPVVNPASAFSNTASGQLLAVVGDDNADRRLDSQQPGDGALDVSQSVPPLGATGVSVALQWSFIEFVDALGLLDPSVTATTIQLTDTTSARPRFVARRAGTYTFELLAEVRDANGAPVQTPFTDGDGRFRARVTYVVVETNPVADAGPDQFVVGLTTTLDATASFDPNLDPPGNTTLSVSWSAVGQNGAVVPASAFSVVPNTMAVAGTPTFTAPAPGTYTITARVFKTTDVTKFAVDTVQVTFSDATDLLPTADAGDDFVRRVGELVTLDGRRSADPEGQPLIYRWSFVSGPTAVTLALDATAQPSFTPTIAGAYTFELVVDDGVYSSVPDQVTVQVIDDQPGQSRRAPAAVAAAGNLRRGVFLEESPNGNWEAAVEVLMADGTRVRPVAVDVAGDAGDDPPPAAVAGTTAIQVYDGALTLLATVYVRIDPATAADPVELLNLGVDEARVESYGVGGQAFVLDGTRSQDDGSIRTFTWTQLDGPTSFGTQTGSLVTVVPTAGTYRFQLVVTDATNLPSRPQEIIIPVVPAPSTTGPPLARVAPGGGVTAVAGDGTPWSPLVVTGQVNANLTLTGAQSRARNGAALASFAWRQVAGPTTVMANADTDTLTVTAKVPGTYRFALKVTDSDGVWSSADVWLTVTAPGRSAPVARIDGPASVVLALGPGGAEFTLRAGNSLGEQPLTLEWGQLQGVPVVLDTTTPMTPRVHLTQPGTYVFTLRVTDPDGVTSAPATVTLWVVGQGDAPLASGASYKESSGGCALTSAALGRPVAPGALMLLGALLGLIALRRRSA